MTDSERHKQTFAAKLAHLIETVHPPDRGRYSYREIAAGIKEHRGAMTAAYIQQLAAGKQSNPRMHYVEALASFFGVPPAYFFDDEVTRQVDAEISDVIQWRDTEAREIVQRINTLSPEHRNAVSEMVNHLANHERKDRARRGRRKRVTDDREDG
ncbi:transcriptional regulator [Actinopolyspora mortivallis]|uniref:transcriptional regulator n=1 Tax=Actinopolyspora mortivallis TaxID=33906 RepID=UPI00037B042D|nr:transcriptional regulator [Actinopolyspora mortivallis]